MDQPTTPAELTIAQRHRRGWAVIEVTGPLRWPYASQLTEVFPPAATLTQSSILLDLTGVTSIDNTGVAVLASIAAQLKHTGRAVRVVIADEKLRRQLPRTVGLQKIFPTVDDAVHFVAGATRPTQSYDVPAGSDQ